MFSRVIDQYLTNDPRRDCEEFRLSEFPRRARTGEPHERLMDHCSCLQRVPAAFALHHRAGNAAQVVIEQVHRVLL